MDDRAGAGAEKRGMHGMISDYLARRPPAQLAADGVIVLIGALVVSHAWSAAFDALPVEMRARPAGSFGAALLRPNALLGLLYNVLFFLAWTILGWAGVRQLAASLHRGGA